MSSAGTAHSSTFALALTGLEGVGHVACNRLLGHFPTYEALREYPVEQFYTRTKGLSQVKDWSKILLDPALFSPYLLRAEEYTTILAEKGIRVLCKLDHDWPARSSTDEHLPPVLYYYGAPESLAMPAVCFLGNPPLNPTGFELAQQICHRLLHKDVAFVTGDESGLDVVLAKISVAAGSACKTLMVHHTGLSRLSSEIRPIASQIVKAGGGLLSGFEMSHGPFNHDKKTRTSLMRACSNVHIHLPSQDGKLVSTHIEMPECATFVVGDPPATISDSLHAISSSADLEWIDLALGLGS